MAQVGCGGQEVARQGSAEVVSPRLPLSPNRQRLRRYVFGARTWQAGRTMRRRAGVRTPSEPRLQGRRGDEKVEVTNIDLWLVDDSLFGCLARG